MFVTRRQVSFLDCLYDLLEGKWTIALRLKANRPFYCDSLKANGLFYCDSLKANRPFYCDSLEGRWNASLDCFIVTHLKASGLLGWTAVACCVGLFCRDSRKCKWTIRLDVLLGLT